MKSFFFICFVLFFVNLIDCQEKQKLEINKDKIFGIPWQSGISEFYGVIGKPTGFIEDKNGGTLYFWGDSFSLQFNKEKNQVISVFIGDFLNGLYFNEKMTSVIDSKDITVGRGVRVGMTFKEMKELFGINTIDDWQEFDTGIKDCYLRKSDGLKYNMQIAFRPQKDGTKQLIICLAISKQ